MSHMNHCNMITSYVCHYSFRMSNEWFMCDMTYSHMTNEHAHAPIWMSWTLATYLYVQHDWFICLTLLRLIHMCGTMCSCAIWHTHMHTHPSRLLENHICMCNMIDSYVLHYYSGLIHVWHDSFMCATWQTNMHMQPFECLEDQSLICTCNMTDLCE